MAEVPGDAPVADVPVLEVSNLSVRFPTRRGEVRAVENVSFRLNRGHTLGVVGESGSGKTVLGRSILGLLPPKLIKREGRVAFEGRDITNLTREEGRRLRGAEIAMVFQDPMTSLNPVMKLGAQITETLTAHLAMSKAEARTTAAELLRSVGISEPTRRLDQYPFELSGGMRQRVTIAIAIACNPKLLLADEPTTALDVTVQAQILDLLEDKQQEAQMAMILVSHDLGVVAGRTDEIAVMYAGRIVEKAPTSELFTEMRMPYTEALMRSIPRLEDPSHTELAAIPGRPPDMVSPPPGCKFAPRCPYAQERCFQEEPPLISDDTVSADHTFACWYPVGTAAGAQARKRNLDVNPLSVTLP